VPEDGRSSRRVAAGIVVVAAAKVVLPAAHNVVGRRGPAGVSLTVVGNGSIASGRGSARTSDGWANFAADDGFNGVYGCSVYNEKKQSSDSDPTDG
jgi:hypothetical protein